MNRHDFISKQFASSFIYCTKTFRHRTQHRAIGKKEKKNYQFFTISSFLLAVNLRQVLDKLRPVVQKPVAVDVLAHDLSLGQTEAIIRKERVRKEI